MAESFSNLIAEFISGMAKAIDGIFSDIEKQSYIELVNCLKKQDELAVKDAVEELIREGNRLAIPPLFLTAKKHPNFFIRDYCLKSIGRMESIEKINSITKDKDIKDAMETLIAEYGNYRMDFRY